MSSVRQEEEEDLFPIMKAASIVSGIPPTVPTGAALTAGSTLATTMMPHGGRWEEGSLSIGHPDPLSLFLALCYTITVHWAGEAD